MALGISEEEWLKELERVRSSNPDGLTTREWRKRLGGNLQTVRLLLKEAIQAGLMEHNGTRSEYRMDGVPCRVPVYRVVEKSGKKGR